MTNAEKYLKDGVDVEEFVSKFEEYYDTKAENYIGTKIDFLKAFLQESVKPTLTEDEKVILRNIRAQIKIGRTEKSQWIYVKDIDNIMTHMLVFNHLFQFIQPRRRI